ncbi:MAG: glycosyltransferase [Gemmatimonadaceae bacterium]
MRIVFAGGGTGGHLYPGLAIARTLVSLDRSIQPFFIGARRGVERDVLPTTEFPHILLDLHPLYRSKPWRNWKTLAGAAGAWGAIGAMATDERPALVVGTGGYASALALGYAVVHRIPIALQEQNSFPGLTTRMYSRYAREVFLGYSEAASWLSLRKRCWIGETGNPIDPPPTPRPDRMAARREWGLPDLGVRVLLAFGGSQGSRALNEVLDAWITRGLPDGLSLIWGTGRSMYDQYSHRENNLIKIRPYLSPISDAYAASDLALTRAGALTLAELCAWGIPQILVPLPTAAANHQVANARALAAAGAAVMVPEGDFSVDALHRTVQDLLDHRVKLGAMAKASLERARPRAAEDIARRILSLIHLRQIHS